MKILFFSLFFSFGLISFGADPIKGTFSPYSFYGLGERAFRGSVENMSMGGISANINNPLITNINNPASFSTLNLVNFFAGLAVSQNYYSQENITSANNSTQINSIGIGIPLIDKVLGISFGIFPYSYTGYRIENKTTISDQNNRYDILSGNGGMNNIYFGSGYSINDYLRIGINFNYLFGNIEKKSEYTEDIFDFTSTYSNHTFLNGVGLDFGIQGEFPLNEIFKINYGIVYKLGSNLSADITDRSLIINKYSGLSFESDSEFLEERSTKLKLNDEFNFALGLGNLTNWNISFQYDFISNNSTKINLDNSSSSIKYNSGNKISIGGYWTPSNNIYHSFFSRITYRAGFFYEKKDFSIFGNNLYDRGFSAGVSVPFSRASYFSVGFMKGTFGENSSYLIKDSYWKIYLSINFNDRWFIKYKYD